MRADNSHLVIAAARRRAAATCKRAVTALRRMETTGAPITFDSVAREARVSRSWLYSQNDLRAEVERLRARQRPATPPTAVPDRQRGGDRLCPARARPTQTAHQRLGIAHPHRAQHSATGQRRTRHQGHRHEAVRLTAHRANPPQPRLHQTRPFLPRPTRPRSSPSHLNPDPPRLSAGLDYRATNS